MTGRSKVFVWFLLGTWLLQVAWIAAVPPFRGLDEHEHAYKAAAVARGDWGATHEASPDGWGERLVVPADLVDAATPVCRSLPYTTADNCSGNTPDAKDQRQVASSAARYNPAFYAVVGTAALPFDGTTALYALRLSGAVLCSLLLAWAASVLSTRPSARWGLLCLVAAVTPIVLYSTVVAAPNGLELAAAALMWCVLLALRDRRAGEATAPHMAAMTVAGVALALCRTLGPLWLVLIMIAGVVLLGRRRSTDLLRIPRVGLALGTIITATAAGVAWTAAARTNSPGGPLGVSDEAWSILPSRWALWVFQSVAAFPARNEIAPLAVYALVFFGWALILLVALRRGGSRLRRVVIGLAGVSAAIPSAATLLTYAELGDAWQGRYTYPLSMGVILLCAARPTSAAIRRLTSSALPAALVFSLLVFAPNAISVLHVVRGERTGSPLAGSPAWWDVPDPVLLILLLTGSAGWFMALRTCEDLMPPPARRSQDLTTPVVTSSNLAR